MYDFLSAFHSSTHLTIVLETKIIIIIIRFVPGNVPGAGYSDPEA